ncbi:MAG TPA: GDP-L-fucose synthase, partial [Longimicrobium sp.]|nr:GDP-L-fucose synthase [Longimicrobium sp.]
RTHAELDLENQSQVQAFFQQHKPEYVILAAAKVGGILANNTYPAQFIFRNLAIQNNVIDQAYRNGVTRLLFLGSSCIYPRECPQPMREEHLLTGPLEPTNRPYALAKIAGIEMCWSYNREYGTKYMAVMHTNLYGPNDNYDLGNSHVLPALIRKAHEAKVRGEAELVVWGSGRPMREFLHVDDMADACVFLMERYDGSEIVNIGCGEDVSIAELAEVVRRAVGYEGEIVYDRSKPDGTPRKLLDVSRLKALGWSPTVPLERGVRETYAWYLEHAARPARLQPA